MITQFILFGIRLLTIVSAPIKRETPLVVGAEALGPIDANSGTYEDVDEDEGLF